MGRTFGWTLMTHFLVVYATTEGQTGKIANRVASRLRACGGQVSLVDARAAAALELGTFDGAVLAASLHLGRHQKEMVDFIRLQRARLERVPTAFISVSLSAAGGSEDLANAEIAVEDLFDALDWEATSVHLAAGAVHDTRLNFLKRWVIHGILREKGIEPDPSGDMEFTDWPALDLFTDSFCRLAARKAKETA
ncbi:MAG: protoporphyrinogen oxidase [Stappia sp.]|nr:protoporphyrinogen oxidase [Stappia sp.]